MKWAAAVGHRKIIQMMLDLGANEAIKDAAENSSLEIIMKMLAQKPEDYQKALKALNDSINDTLERDKIIMDLMKAREFLINE